MAAQRRNSERLYRLQVSLPADAGTERGTGGTRRTDDIQWRLRRIAAGGRRKGESVPGGDQATLCHVRKKLGWVVRRDPAPNAASCRTIGRRPALLAAAVVHLRNSLRVCLSSPVQCFAG